ncbi:MAG: helix-turn-helix domain-containing protein [Atopobiaceae bacterium]|nr:helix-turn-helix domain-containing protein [Atopobiaceae bacterium]
MSSLKGLLKRNPSASESDADGAQPAQPKQVYDMAGIGREIRHRRKCLGYTQAQVAMLMGCSPRLISEIERGRDTVAIGTVLRLVTGLGMDVILKERG